MQRSRLVVLDVHAHLHVSDTREGEPERTDAREPSTLLANEHGDRTGDVDVVRFQIHVEGDQRATSADDHTPRPLVQASRPEVRSELAGVETALQLVRTAPPVKGRPAIRSGLSIEKGR